MCLFAATRYPGNLPTKKLNNKTGNNDAEKRQNVQEEFETILDGGTVIWGYFLFFYLATWAHVHLWMPMIDLEPG